MMEHFDYGWREIYETIIYDHKYDLTVLSHISRKSSHLYCFDPEGINKYCKNIQHVLYNVMHALTNSLNSKVTKIIDYLFSVKHIRLFTQVPQFYTIFSKFTEERILELFVADETLCLDINKHCNLLNLCLHCDYKVLFLYLLEHGLEYLHVYRAGLP